MPRTQPSPPWWSARRRQRRDERGWDWLRRSSSTHRGPTGSRPSLQRTTTRRSSIRIASTFVFSNPPVVRDGMQKVAGGNVSWNDGVDYRSLLERSGMKEFVAALYRRAGLDLDADLTTLKEAPRLFADPQALAKAEPLMTYTGKISGPIMNVDNADPVDPAPLKLAYIDTLKRAKTDHLLRLCWVRGAGHGGQTEIDRIAGLVALIKRLDTGTWDDTSAAAMNALAAQLAANTKLQLGSPTFIEYQPPKPLRTWDVSNWVTYRP